MNKIQDLLNWCKFQTEGYLNVAVTNFTTSWRDGLAFSALIHKFKPELINFHELESINVYYNNDTAFKTAQIYLGIPSLLDPKDMCLMECPESLSIITYVSQYYNCLKSMKPEGGYDINKFRNLNVNSDMESISSRTSLKRLARLKCTICNQKVSLLERYVADDKLYHRKCYRIIQIKNIDNDSEIIGDYLNIYGHIQEINGTGEKIDIETAPPNNIVEEFLSDIAGSENLSQSLTTLLSSDENSGKINIETDEKLNVNSDMESILSRISIERLARLKCTMCNQKVSLLERYVADDKLYHRKCCRKIYDHIQEINGTGEKIDIETAPPDNIVEESLSDIAGSENMSQSLTTFLSSDEDSENTNIETDKKEYVFADLNDPVNHVLDNEFIGTDKHVSFDINRNEIIPDDVESELKFTHSIYLNTCLQNFTMTSNSNPDITSSKPGLYFKKRDKGFPYSTFFEIPYDEPHQTEEKTFHDDKSVPLLNQDVLGGPYALTRKKLIEISSIDDALVDSVKSQTFRNSIWRKPIISSISSSKSKGDSISLDRKFRDYAEFKDRLEELNIKQSQIESVSRHIHYELCKENSNTPLYEELMNKWLDLVEEKQQIYYEENALYSWFKDLKLQKRKHKLETQIRILLSSTNYYLTCIYLHDCIFIGPNDSVTVQRLKELIAQLVDTVNQRNMLVDHLHEQNLTIMDSFRIGHQAKNKEDQFKKHLAKHKSPVKPQKRMKKENVTRLH